MKWIRSQKLQPSDFKKVRALKEACTLPGKVEYNKLKEVIRANPQLRERCHVSQLCGMVVSMQKGGLKSSSISTTLRKIISFKRYDWPAKAVKRAVRLAEHVEAHGHEARKAAPVMSREETKALCKTLEDIPLRAVIELMANSPMRMCDVRATTFERVNVGANFVEVKLQGGKTTKARLAREKFRVKSTVFSTATLNYLRKGKTMAADSAICRLTTTAINRELSKRGIKATTYSFRNLWIEETILGFTDDKGVTDWPMVQRVTLHRSIKALKSNYGYVFDRNAEGEQ